VRKAHTDFIQNTVNRDNKDNSKRFWSDIKSKRQEPAGISPLLNKDGFLHSDSQIKAEILNNHFSPFTQKRTQPPSRTKITALQRV
jgi:predicted AAA+ superfamily ATPase